jgi:alkylation response protein AidB-like acyl-CoA dehydrogenase/class 3 adenylate cyclase
MSELVALILCLSGGLALATRRAPQWIWALAILAITATWQTGLFEGRIESPSLGLLRLLGWLPALLFGVLSIPSLRRSLLVAPAFNMIRRGLPRVTETAQQALGAGTVGFDAEIFGGKPDWKKLRAVPPIKLTDEEKAFLDGPTEELCRMIDDWQVRHNQREIPEEIWDFVKKHRFLGMQISKKYGGLGFSAQAQSLILGKVASRSADVFAIITIPNSLGPGELIEKYGTDEQKHHYLPRLVKGDDIPCLALTGPTSGSDAATMRDIGTVARGKYKGADAIGIRVSWDKRYITLAPKATLVGLAFHLFDPENLLGKGENVGITVALVPADHPGVVIGRCHLSSGAAFPNGPTWGEDVFIPLVWVIGGEEMVGQGWGMLMECLSASRAISLPSCAAAGAKSMLRVSTAYGRIRKQFGLPLARMEAIEEVTVKCPRCKAVNPGGKHFCGDCGAALPQRCPTCGSDNSPEMQLCSACGSNLRASAFRHDHGEHALAATGAERRPLSVAFCDLVGSTALSARLDPEDLRDVIAVYHRCVSETMYRYDGFIARYQGDGVLVYFGYPHAHEDDAERAVFASLALVEAVEKLRPASIHEPIRVRVGISTGTVVVGDLIGVGAAQEYAVVGEAPNRAARLQALAEPNAVVICADTKRLTAGLFEYRDLGTPQLKGFPGPLRAWHVVGPSGVESRFEALRSTALTRLVGREEELEMLLRRWRQAAEGEGRVMLITGESGIGKSRLAVALQERLRGEAHTHIRYFCSPHRQDTALYPVVSHLERIAGFAHDDAPERKLDKLAALLALAGPVEGDISLIAEVMSVPGGELYAPLDLSPQRKKERTLAALFRQLEGLARRQPVLMTVEDLHWIDPTSREVLDLLVKRIDRLSVLLVATCPALAHAYSRACLQLSRMIAEAS